MHFIFKLMMDTTPRALLCVKIFPFFSYLLRKGQNLFYTWESTWVIHFVTTYHC